MDKLKTDLAKIEERLQTPEVWSNQKLASELGQQSKEIKQILDMVNEWDSTIEDAQLAYEMEDEELISEANYKISIVIEIENRTRSRNKTTYNEKIL